MKRIYGFLVVGLLIASCGGSSAEDDKLKLEKEKLELEKKKLELEKEKMSSGETSEKGDNSVDEKEEKKSKNVKQPSVSSQESIIYDFYRDFDNAFDQSSMREYIDNYYGSSVKPTYLKAELPSYQYYSSKEHSIDDISLISETDETRRYKVIFYFTFERTNGTTGSNKCADMLTLDNNNMIIARSELGKVK
jgi:hypothetical protein